MSEKVNALAGFTAILADNSVLAARPNKLKLEKDPNAAPEFYARVCYPADAQQALWAVIAECATGNFGSTNGITHGIKINSSQKKPIAGIDPAAIVVRASTQYAPELYDSDGTVLDRQNPQHVKIIKEKFFPGAHVRAVLSPFPWNHKLSGNGVSLNLAGLMAVPAENVKRLAVGGVDTSNAFAAYVKPGTGGSHIATAAAQPSDANATAAPANTGNPFAQAGGNPAAGGNPFA